MDNKILLIGFVLLALTVIALILISPQTPQLNLQTTTTSEPTATTPTQPPTTTTETTSTSTTTSTMIPTTTTTTLPELIPMPWWDMSKCRESRIGKMNIFYANITDDIQGKWNESPANHILYSCDGSPLLPVDEALYKGLGTVNLGEPIAGSYRLQVRCGHNTQIDDLNDCRNLQIFLNTSIINTQ